MIVSLYFFSLILTTVSRALLRTDIKGSSEKRKTMDTALMETNHSKDFIVRLALLSKMEEGMVSKEESRETSLVAEVDGDEHSKMFLVKMAVPSLFFAASFVAFIWYSPA